MTTDELRDDPPPVRRGAVRLIFEYEGTEIRLISQQRVEMTPPPSDRLEEQQAVKGFWIEVRDADGRPLYRRIMHNPVRHDVEVFSEDPARSIARMPTEAPRGTFAVVVPELDQADHVALVGSPLGPGPTVAPAAELARFAIGPNAAEGSH